VAFENGVVVSTTRMNRVLSIDLDSRVAHVEAGVRNVQLTDAVSLLPGGSAWHFSPDPSSQRASTLGGNAATNAGGIHVLKDFASANHVLGMEVVLADGSVVNVGGQKRLLRVGQLRPAGPHLRLRGHVGIITKLWVRLTPKATELPHDRGDLQGHRRRVQRRQRTSSPRACCRPPWR
jgi:glycolate oxidase